jgi:nitrogen fixation protein NifU and related proteins
VYSSQLLDHFEHPRNAGVLTAVDALVQVENPACGDVVQLSAQLRDGMISQIRFQAKGCVPSIACASAITELVKEMSIAEAKNITREEVLFAVGGVPPASTHAAQLAIDALMELLDHVSGSADCADDRRPKTEDGSHR